MLMTWLARFSIFPVVFLDHRPILQLLFVVSVVVGKYDKLAAILCALIDHFYIDITFPGLSNFTIVQY